MRRLSHVLLTLLLLGATSAEAQTRARRRVAAGEITGLEMGIEGSLQVIPGGTLRWFVTVYEVVRRRELRPSGDTTLVVSSSFSRGEPLAEVTTDARGRAAIEVAIPEDVPAHPTLRVEARSPRRVRRVFSVGLQRQPRHYVELFVDRTRVLPGGSVIAFGRVIDRASGAPAADVEVRASHAEEPLRTDARGVFVFEATGPEAGGFTVSARTDHGSASRTIDLEPAQTPALWVQARPTRPVAEPGQAVPVEVLVRTRQGVPIEGARLRWLSQSEDPDPERRIRTDAEGRARIDWVVARVAREPVQTLTRRLSVISPRRGSLEHAVSLRVARVPALAAWSVEGGALVPTLPGRVYVRVVRPDGSPAADTSLSLEAPRLGGALTADTDADGVARFEGTVTEPRAPDECGGSTALAATVVIGEHRQRLCLPVDPDATLAVRARAEGSAVEARVQRVGEVRDRPVELTALRRDGGGWAPLATAVLEASETRGSLELPAVALGEVWVRARPILARGGTARGGSAMVWVGARPDAPRLEAGPAGARVASEAGTDLIVATEAGGAEALRASLASALGTVGAAIDEGRSARFVAALLSARTPDDRAASVAFREGSLVPQPLPRQPVEHGLLRDPWRTQARFIRGRVGRLMRAVEQYADAAIPDSLPDVAVRERGRWRFNHAVLEAATARAGLGDETAAALDGEPLDIDALTAMDASFTYDRVARRITRERLFRVNVLLRELVRERGLDLPWALRGDPRELVVSLLEVREMGGFSVWPERAMLFDAWGQPFVLRRVRGRSRFSFLQPVEGWELVSPGPDQRPGTRDDVVDPFARVLPSGGIYAEAVGEDILLARLNGVALGRATVSMLTQLFEVERPELQARAEAGARDPWGELPAPSRPRMDAAPVTPIRDALGGRGPAVEWELPSERRAYDVTAITFTEGGAIRTARDELVAGAPWVARVELPEVLRPGEQLSVPLRLTRLVSDAPHPTVQVEVRGRALEARLDGERLALEATRPGLADLAVHVRLDERRSSTFERRVRVVPDAALRSRVAALWAPAEGAQRLTIHTPDEATPWRGRLVLASPRGVLRAPGLAAVRERYPEVFAWAAAMTDGELEPELRWAVTGGGPIETACAMVSWAAHEDEAHRVRVNAGHLAESIGDDLAVRATVLTALAASATLDPEGGDDPVGDLIAELRQDGWRTLARASDRPALMARMAAGLLLADRRDAAGTALLEGVVTRLEEDDYGRRWVPGRPERAGDEWIGTLALAIAARQAGRDALADELARTVSSRLDRAARLDVEGAFWAAAASVYAVFGVDGPERVRVTIDGQSEPVSLEDGHAEVRLPASADVTVEADAPVVATAEERYLVERAERTDAPLSVRIEGTPGRAGQRTGYELVVENPTEADVGAPRIELGLPGAARCDDACRHAMERADEVRHVAEPDLAGVLRIDLAPVPARSERRVPLTFDWIASGRTRGLSVTAYHVARPSELFVAPARTLTVEEAP